MALVLVLLLLLFVAACPRQANETVPGAPTRETHATPDRKPSATEAQEAKDKKFEVPETELLPPIPYLALGSQMYPAALPGEVLSAHPKAKVSKDKSQLSDEASGVWYQGFTTPASEKTLKVYYDGILGVKGFTPLEGEATETGRPRFSHSWESKDKRYEVSILSGPVSAAKDQKYLLRIQDRGGTGQGGEGPEPPAGP